ncbi:MAG: hypothetical protein OHK93_000777 [Ramalina farinacea]|uniref:NADP-dependent oxidoreductase domain-containing protein n=1 Tax=Ramalina farinacea TaxID=258253 RepID=A0AA43QN95_9LECA|nr:hypothetical protein [Ramalina farinacea]
MSTTTPKPTTICGREHSDTGPPLRPPHSQLPPPPPPLLPHPPHRRPPRHPQHQRLLLPHHRSRALPPSIRASVDAALTILADTKKIDIFEPARLDPSSTTPLEESIATLADLMTEGKIGGIGLSEVSAQTVRRAAAVHPIAAVEIELSLFTPEPLNAGGVVDTCRELGIPVVAYSPLGRGFLTGKVRTRGDLAEGDFRRKMPRFADAMFENNWERVRKLEEVARRKGVSVAQLAIAWVCAKGAVPIPGSTIRQSNQWRNRDGKRGYRHKDCDIQVNNTDESSAFGADVSEYAAITFRMAGKYI